MDSSAALEPSALGMPATASSMTLFLDCQTHVAGSTAKAAAFDGLTLTGCTPSAGPLITQQPGGQNICAGATATFTPDVPCYVMLMTSFQFDWNKTDLSDAPTHVQEGVLTVDGTAQSYSAIARYIGSGLALEDRQFTNTVSEVYRVALTAVSHTIKLQAKHTTFGLSAELSQCAKAHALYFLVAQS